MSDPEAARRDAFEDDVRTALFRPGGELRRMQFRLMGFVAGVALLVVLAPTWYVTERRQTLHVYSGMSLFGLTPGKDSPMGALGTALLLGYLLLALALLVAPPETTFALVAGIAGLLVTFVIIVNPPASADTTDVNWTGAPIVALALWLLAITLSAVSRSASHSR